MTDVLLVTRDVGPECLAYGYVDGEFRCLGRLVESWPRGVIPWALTMSETRDEDGALKTTITMATPTYTLAPLEEGENP